MFRKRRPFKQFYLSIIFIVCLIGCSDSMPNLSYPDSTVTDTYRTPENVVVTVTPTIYADSHAMSSVTPSLQLSPVAQISPDPSPEISPNITDTPHQVQEIQGTLFGNDETGIWQQQLPDGNKSHLLIPEDTWLGYSFSFSPNGKWLIYWWKSETTSEIWWGSLVSWNPQQLMTLPLYQSEITSFTWLGGDKYVLIELLDDFESPISIRKETHLIDMTTQSIVFSNKQETPDSHAQTCEMLAISPETNSLSLWCPLDSTINQTPTTSYMVLEINGMAWISQNPPTVVLEPERDYEWSVPIVWSGDGQLVSYILTQRIEHLYYSSVNAFAPIELLDYQSTSYRHISFSPDNKFLAYEGECNGQSCIIVMDLVTQAIVWSNQGLPDHASSLASFAWSPDSHYLAINNVTQNIFIVDIFNSDIVKYIQGTEFNGIIAWGS